MSLNTSKSIAIAARRREVARLRLQGLTLREIQAKVGCSLGTVHADLEALETDWRAQAEADILDWKALQLAELREVKRVAWENGRLAIVLQALKLEAELTGTKAKAEDGEPMPIQIVLDR